MVSVEEIKSEYPLHWTVWQNDHRQLETLLKSREHDKEQRDVRGRTPLMLAVTLGHLESARTLLSHDANVNCENRDGWTVVQEAVATGDPELLQLVLERRDYQRYSNRMAGIPGLLQRLKEAPDFYMEMKWEFTSWVPLVSRMCPSDTYKVYKQGSNVRVDTTLLGFDHTNWQRGNRSYVFQGYDDTATMMEIDHDLHEVYSQQMRSTEEALGGLLPTDESVSQRLTNPIVTTYVDTDKISFERNKGGLWGWRSDKSEVVNGYECKVFNASNVELVTKTRTEHLTENDKLRSKNERRNPLQNLLGIVDTEEDHSASGRNHEKATSTNPCNITVEEYFDSSLDLNGRDIGRPKELSVKIQKFKANLWLSEHYPLSLPEQILPVVDLMAMSSSHFAKLKDFIQMQLPSGFPVKIEIPLFHVLNARITFGNIFGLDLDIPHVTRLEEDNRLTCVLDDCIFRCPPGYTKIAGMDSRRQFGGMEEEDDLLQFAIQQSLIDAGTEKEEVDIWEALKAQKPSRPETPNFMGGEEEKQLQRAIQESLELCRGMPTSNDDATNTVINPTNNEEDSDLHMALLLSQQECHRQEQQRLQEERELQEILRLSLTDK